MKAAVISQLKANFEKISYQEATSYIPNPNKSKLDGVSTGTGMIPSDFVNVSVKFDADIRVVNNKDQQFDLVPVTTDKNGLTTINSNPFIPRDPAYNDTRRSDEHLIEVKSDKDLPGLYGKVNEIGGKELYLNVNAIPKIILGKDNNTVFHELGHSLGLRHINKLIESFRDFLGGNPQYMNSQEQATTPNNAMYSGDSKQMNDSTSTDLKPSQLKKVLQNYKDKKINKNK